MKKDMPLEGLRWSRDSGSALYDTPQNGRSRTGWGAWAQTTKRPASGDGTVDNPFLISTAAELAWFRDHVNEDYANVKASAKLIADIDLSEF